MTSSRLARAAKTARSKTFQTPQRKDTFLVSVKNKTNLTCTKRTVRTSHTQNTACFHCKYQPIGVVQENNSCCLLYHAEHITSSAWKKLSIFSCRSKRHTEEPLVFTELLLKYQQLPNVHYGRPAHDQQHCYHHAPTVKPEAATAVVKPQMMGARTPETC